MVNHGDVVVALLNNDSICKRLCLREKCVILQFENSKYPYRHGLEGDDLSIWGVITYTERSLSPSLRIMRCMAT